MGAVFIALYGFVQPYAVSLGAKEVRWFFVGYTVSVVAGRIFLGQLGDRAGRRNVSMWMLCGYAVASALMVRFEVDLLAAYGLVFGAAHGLAYPTLNALLIEFLPVSRRGLAMVLYNGGFNLGSSIGAFAWGVLAAGSGYAAVYEVSAVCSIIAAGILFARRSDELRAQKHR
jgi:MFS family permease